MGLELAGVRVGSCPQRAPFPSSYFCPFLQPGHSPGSVSGDRRQLLFPAGLRLGQGHTVGHACACTCARAHTHTRTSTGAGTVALSQDWLSPDALVPQHTCAGYCLPGSRGRWHEAEGCPGWVSSALHSGSLIYKDSVPPSERWACLTLWPTCHQSPAQQRICGGPGM